MGQGILRVSLGLLPELLHLPAGTRIVQVVPNERFHPDIVAFLVEHHALPDTPPGLTPPEVNPTFRRDKRLKPTFIDWGL